MPSLASHPVRRPPQPRYPTRLDVRNDPDLLARHLPPSWLGRNELAGAMGVLLAVNTGYAQSPTEATKPAAASRPAATTQPAATAPADAVNTARAEVQPGVLPPTLPPLFPKRRL